MTPDAAAPRSRADDDALLRSLVAAYAHGLRSFLSRLEHDPQDVEEVLADLFVLAHANIDTLAVLHDAQVRVWLYRAAKLLNANRSRSKLRRRQQLDRVTRQLAAGAPADDEFDAVEAALDAVGDADRIAATMAALRPEHRQVLVLDALGRTGTEIADELGISAVAARKRLMHARVAFRSAWADDGAAGGVADEPPTERSRP